MKPKFILLSFFLVILCVSLSYSSENQKILVLITNDADLSQSIEPLIAKHLSEAGYQVVTADELTLFSELSPEDISDVRKGDLSKVKKAAGACGTNFVFIASVKNELTSKELMGMKMNKSCATVSYKILDIDLDKIVKRDTIQNVSTGRTPEIATNTSFNNIAGDISQSINKNILSRSAEEPSSSAAVEDESEPETAVSGSEPEDTALTIAIISPVIEGKRGIRKREKTADETLTIKGQVTDQKGIQSIKVNNQSVIFDARGYFSYNAALGAGDNRFVVTATNKEGKTANKDFVITKESTETEETFPVIAIISPDIEGKRGIRKREKISDETLAIKGQVTDQKGIQSIKVNDQPVIFDARGYFSYNAALAAGDNRFVVTATNKDGKTANKDFVITKESQIKQTGIKPVLWGLTIGVSRYEKSSMSLRYADADALSLAEFLKKQEGRLFSEVHCKTLVNEAVTRDSILENISSHLGKAAPDDVIFIFLAGHGIKHSQSGSYYFFPFDATLNTVVSKGMRMSDFEESVKILSKNTNVGKLILAIDTCHSGSLDIGLRAGGGGENLADALKESTGQFILAASKGGEPSVEDSKYILKDNDSGHGVFTYTLINGMKGEANYDGDNYISLGELFQYVAKQVPRLTDGLQHPYFRMSGTDMPLVLLEK